MVRLKASERRSLLVRAAVEVIATHGVEGATTRRIAAAAGASLASLHYIFESKDALFFAIWEEQVQALDERARAGAQRNGLGPTADRLLRETFEWFKLDEPFVRVQLELTFWALRREGGLGMRTYELHTAVMRAALHYGRLPDEDAAAVDGLARLIVALADGIAIQWLCYRDPARMESDLDAATAALLGFADRQRSIVPLSD